MPRFPNLLAEMARKGLKTKHIAEALSISQKSAYNKLNGITDFTLSETVKVRDAFFMGMSIEFLFEKGGQEVDSQAL